MLAIPLWLACMLLLVGGPKAEAQVPGSLPQKSAWMLFEPGLELGEFPAPQKSGFGDPIIRVLRIDPSLFTFRLLNASASPEKKPLTGRGWAGRHNLVAVINASIFKADGLTSVALMKTRDHVNNPKFSKDKSILAFDPLEPSLPGIKIADRECDDFTALGKKYGTLVQSIRMVSCRGKNVWAPQAKKWSTAAVGIDRSGRVLFIHSRSPYSTHDLIDILLKLPLELDRAMYVEGGPEAQLYVRSGEKEFEFLGSYETGFNENNDNDKAWPVPNIIGVVRKTAEK